jgi:nucleotide-binding universal stress UspA family protein
MKTILLATDGSDSSERALAFAIELAQETGASLEVVCVRQQWSRVVGVAPAPKLATHDASERAAESAASRARRAGVASTAHVVEGDTVGCIVEATRRTGAELLVVGSRGLGSISGAALGSVSQALIRRSPIPVTVVRHLPALSMART